MALVHKLYIWVRLNNSSDRGTFARLIGWTENWAGNAAWRNLFLKQMSLHHVLNINPRIVCQMFNDRLFDQICNWSISPSLSQYLKSLVLAAPLPSSRAECVRTPRSVDFPASTFPTTATLTSNSKKLNICLRVKRFYDLYLLSCSLSSCQKLVLDIIVICYRHRIVFCIIFLARFD